MGIGDSCATGSYACLNAKVVDVKPAGNHRIKVALSNGAYIHSTHVGHLPHQHLPIHARLVYLCPKLNKVLLYLGQFCDANMKIILTKKKLLAVVDNESNDVMLEGTCSTSNGVWYIDLEKSNKPVNSKNNMTKIITGTPNNNDDDTIKRGISNFPISQPMILSFLNMITRSPLVRQTLCVSSKEKITLFRFYPLLCGIQCLKLGHKQSILVFATWPDLTSKLIKKTLAKAIRNFYGPHASRSKEYSLY